jgi:hypothetical protein
MPLIIFWSKFQEKMTNALASSFLHEYNAPSLPFSCTISFQFVHDACQSIFYLEREGGGAKYDEDALNTAFFQVHFLRDQRSDTRTT